ncbi:MAG: endonuclease [Oscillospiraceae bacterium]
MKKILLRTGIVLLCIILALLLIVGSYIVYLEIRYKRIQDPMALDITPGEGTNLLQSGQTYTVLTYNVGYGAFNHDFSSFTDSGVMADGTPVSGEYTKAQSLEIVTTNISGSAMVTSQLSPDFALFQEVDRSGVRSFNIEENAVLAQALPGYYSTFAKNSYPANLVYPPSDPIGEFDSGLLTLSSYSISSAERRSYPVDTSFITKFFDLDRCFSIQRIPVEGGKELVLINSHMSAFDKGGVYRTLQMQLLTSVLAEEYEKGNWVIAGGDFNHALGNSLTSFPSGQQVPEWIHEFDESMLPSGFSVVVADNANAVPSVRSVDMPYIEGINYTSIVDGFVVSDNISAIAQNVDVNFKYSDHNPVLLTFSLQ